MSELLMPKATAVWLVENTGLTFDQIADFCGLHRLEVQAIADGEVNTSMRGMDPIGNGQLTQEEIARCEQDPTAELVQAKRSIPLPAWKTKGARYTPVAKRQDKPDAIAWLLKHYPDLTDAQISRLIGTTKPTIQAVRDRTHWNASNITPRDPVELGLCKVVELDQAQARADRAKARVEKEAAKAQRKKEAEEMATAAATLTGGSEADKAGAHWPEDPDQPKPASTETPGAAQHWPEDPENPPTSGGDGQENGPEQSS